MMNKQEPTYDRLHEGESKEGAPRYRTEMISLKEALDQTKLKKVASLLRRGETVAIPTETVYGLAADATQEEAVQRIFQAKGRPSDNPLIVHVAKKEQVFELAGALQPYVEALIDYFSPGPITYIVPDAGRVAPTVTAGLSTVGVRIPNHPVALAILQEVNRPLAAPSANLSGRPSPTEASHVEEDLAGRIPAIVDGGQTEVGIESTVLDCTGPVPVILRPGAITPEEIRQVVGACEVYRPKKEERPKSPGLKYVHYAPEVPLFLVEKEVLEATLVQALEEKQRVGLLYHTDAYEDFPIVRRAFLGRDAEESARRLYHLLRSFSKEEVDLILCEYPTAFTNQAVLDRLRRASTKIVYA